MIRKATFLFFLLFFSFLSGTVTLADTPKGKGYKLFCIEGQRATKNFNFYITVSINGQERKPTLSIQVAKDDTAAVVADKIKDALGENYTIKKLPGKEKCPTHCFAAQSDVDITIKYNTNGGGTLVGDTRVPLEKNDQGGLGIKDPFISFINNDIDNPLTNSCSISGDSECEECLLLLAHMNLFEISVKHNKPVLKWTTLMEKDNTGFRVWRSVKNNDNHYTNITMLTKLTSFQTDCTEGELTIASPESSQLILAAGNERQGACYTFVDNTITQEGTYYYVLEDIDNEGKSTFHCNNLAAATIGQGLAIDLESATNYCKQVTGSGN